MKSYFFIRTDNRCVKVNFADILYMEANRNYVRIIAQSRTYVVLLPLKQLETLLPEDSFCRVHRSYIVSLDHVLSFDQIYIYVQEGNPKKKPFAIPIGLQYRKYLRQKVNVVATEATEAYKLSSMSIGSLIDESRN